MRRGRLLVMGASGAGTTTLGRAVADHWSVPHADADDYFWVPTDPPYVEKRPEPDRLALMRQVFLPREAWVLSGSLLGWGESVAAACDAVVFVTLGPEERLRRLQAREELRREGQAVDAEAWAAFLEWARGYDDPAFHGRSRAAHERWLDSLGLPVLRLDSARSREELRDAVLGWAPTGRADVVAGAVAGGRRALGVGGGRRAVAGGRRAVAGDEGTPGAVLPGVPPHAGGGGGI